MLTRSRRRLAYLFTLTMGGILVTFAFVIYFLLVRERLRVFDQNLKDEAQSYVFKFKYSSDGKQYQVKYEEIPLTSSEMVPTQFEYTCWYDRLKRPLEINDDSNCPRQEELKEGFQTVKSNQYLANYQRFSLRKLTSPIQNGKNQLGYIVVAKSLQPIQENLKRTRFHLSLGVPATLGIVGIVGWFLGGVAMKPTKRSYEQLQRFTADASHELRAPVAAILSNAQVGLLAPEDNSELPRQRLENIVDISKSMSALIGNLLFLARHEGRLNPKDLRSLEIVGLLNQLSNEYQLIAEEKGLSITAELPSQKITLLADPDLLQQAIKNLLDNACKYTPSEGTVKLKLFTQLRRISIQVIDSGVGIPPEDLPSIFERFYRVDSSRTRSSGGFGLGLAIAQQIVKAHGGEITVASKVEEGTTFQICLPLKKI
ncbi:integral membrane sensor signal transduction histidine kinase [Calothrix parasitica NIES-267]|uniref:histidine kinase n=1 Tax=Calothrix parasitica NIES-267 TaxID=1973488 RepID=A0A1Z4LVR6_9CYAN|nr:integral membrane sensor signal transduction histidine kinase [Calothrix parasitica NIES-267]